MISPNLASLALRRSLSPDLAHVLARCSSRIGQSDGLATILEIILSELGAARIILTRAALADFAVEVFQDRQRAYPETPILNQAGYYG